MGKTLTVFDKDYQPKYQIEECECPRCHAVVRFYQPPTMIDAVTELNKQRKMYEEIIGHLQDENKKLDFELRVKKIELYNTHEFLRSGKNVD